MYPSRRIQWDDREVNSNLTGGNTAGSAIGWVIANCNFDCHFLPYHSYLHRNIIPCCIPLGTKNRSSCISKKFSVKRFSAGYSRRIGEPGDPSPRLLPRFRRYRALKTSDKVEWCIWYPWLGLVSNIAKLINNDWNLKDIVFSRTGIDRLSLRKSIHLNFLLNNSMGSSN